MNDQQHAEIAPDDPDSPECPEDGLPCSECPGYCLDVWREKRRIPSGMRGSNE